LAKIWLSWQRLLELEPRGFATRGARVSLLWQNTAKQKCQRVHACTRSMPGLFLGCHASPKSTKSGSFIEGPCSTSTQTG